MKDYGTQAFITLRVNGEEHQVAVRAGDTLPTILRETLGLTGTKLACENGDCGACTILLEGRPVKSCMILAVEVEGKEITTIEGLKDSPVQRAFLEHQGFQCGFCTPGFIMNTAGLLREKPQPTEEEIRGWMEGNLCRCTGYESIAAAVKGAVSGKG